MHAAVKYCVYRAPDDIQNSDKIRSLLKDIREARQAKSREGLQKIDHSELSVSARALPVPICLLTVVVSYRTYVLWKSMKFDLSSCEPWAFSRNLPANLRLIHNNCRDHLDKVVWCTVRKSLKSFMSN
jgi:hypothetical protein